MKKVAIVGAHGIGKTTLAKALTERANSKGKKAIYLEEMVRSCPYPIHEKQSIEATEWIIFNQILAEHTITAQNPDFIFCDRSCYDPIVYHEIANMPDIDSCRALMGTFRALKALAACHLREYHSIIFIFPSEKPIDIDGFRNIDREYRDKISRRFRRSLRPFFKRPLRSSSNEDPEFPVFFVKSSFIFNSIDDLMNSIFQYLNREKK